MRDTIRLLFKHEDTRKRILFTILVLMLIQVGCHIPTYGVNADYMAALLSGNGTLNLLDAMTGNSLSRLSLFTLSITPYITASIVMQLLMIAIPRLEHMVKDEIDGKEKYEKITYIVGGVMGYLEAGAMAIGFGKSGLLISYTWYNVLIVTLLWGSCALLAVFAGKRIDKKGIGNGISLILLFNIVSSFPGDLMEIVNVAVTGHHGFTAVFFVAVGFLAVVALFAFCIFLNDAEKKIPVQYTKAAGKFMPMKSFIPIKVCIAGVLPVIFASSLMSFPTIITSFTGATPDGWGGKIISAMNSSNWFNLSAPMYTIGYLVYALLVFFFGYFYTNISFNTTEVAENLRKSGGTIAGIRPGRPTKEYLDKQLKYLIFLGTAGLLVIATVPILASGIFGLGSLSLGGTSIIIIVGVVLETRETLVSESVSAKAANISGQRLFGHILPDLGGKNA